MAEVSAKLFMDSMKHRFNEINNSNNDIKKLELFIESLKYMYINWKYLPYRTIKITIEKINHMKGYFSLGFSKYKDSQKKKFYEISNKCFELFEKMGYDHRRTY